LLAEFIFPTFGDFLQFLLLFVVIRVIAMYCGIFDVL
jgi:hypothetical protein